MNKANTATSLLSKSNLDNSSECHRNSQNFSVGDWVINGTPRPGQVIDIIERRPGHPKIWVRFLGKTKNKSYDPENLTLIDEPIDKDNSITDAILELLDNQLDWLSEIEIAIELDLAVPIARKYLEKLRDRVETDDNGSWRIVPTPTTEVLEDKQKGRGDEETKEQGEQIDDVCRNFKQTESMSLTLPPPQSQSFPVSEEECQHFFEFSPSPSALGYVERCTHCNQVKDIETSGKLSLLILWLNQQKDEFEVLASNSILGD